MRFLREHELIERVCAIFDRNQSIRQQDDINSSIMRISAGLLDILNSPIDKTGDDVPIAIPHWQSLQRAFDMVLAGGVYVRLPTAYLADGALPMESRFRVAQQRKPAHDKLSAQLIRTEQQQYSASTAKQLDKELFRYVCNGCLLFMERATTETWFIERMIGRYLVDLTLALLHLIRSSYLTDDERRILLDRWMRLPARLGMRTQTTMQTLLTADAFLTAAKRSFSDKESTSETDQLNIVEGTSRECKKQLSICLERDDGLLALLCTICPYNASSDADVEPDTLPPAPVLNALIRVIFTAPAATDKQEYFENLWRQLTQILANGNQYQLLVLELLIKLACENSFMFSHRFSKFLDYSVTENSDLICAIYCHPSNYHVGRLLLQKSNDIFQTASGTSRPRIERAISGLLMNMHANGSLAPLIDETLKQDGENNCWLSACFQRFGNDQMFVEILKSRIFAAERDSISQLIKSFGPLIRFAPAVNDLMQFLLISGNSNAIQMYHDILEQTNRLNFISNSLVQENDPNVAKQPRSLRDELDDAMGWLNASEPYIRAMGVSAIRQLLIADNLLKRELDEKILDGLFIALGDSDSFVHMNAMKAIKEIIMNSKSYGKTTLSTLMDRWCGAIDGNNDEAEGRMCQILLEILGNGAVNIDVDIAHRLLERIVAKISSDSGSDSIILWALLASVLGVSTDLIAQYRPLIHSIIRNIPKALEQQQQQNTEDSLQLQHAIIATLAQLAICLKNAPRLVCSEIDKLNQIISQLLAPQSLLCGESRQRLREILQL